MRDLIYPHLLPHRTNYFGPFCRHIRPCNITPAVGARSLLSESHPTQLTGSWCLQSEVTALTAELQDKRGVAVAMGFWSGKTTEKVRPRRPRSPLHFPRPLRPLRPPRLRPIGLSPSSPSSSSLSLPFLAPSLLASALHVSSHTVHVLIVPCRGCRRPRSSCGTC